ncbi:hypothetical protein [Puniceibacterium confluentis]|uniref:hypothetical protein n=1 Tax=Puniceibacterium confluentis TaxID=1958944 RepID=UPI0011B711C1|nr:hypothetical protein [Puniceibacterium confluentis]
MSRQTLERRIEALESDISGADAQTRHEMIARLKRVVLTLDIGRPAAQRRAGRSNQISRDELAEDIFDNMPI